MTISIFNNDIYEAIWATPLSGYGHISDEQPLPYIHMSGKEMTPRFGGENVSLKDLPLPYGVISSNWPLKQRIFNLFRKRINIYWRELFKSFTRKDNLFSLYQQCNFYQTSTGFKGVSPVVEFERIFTFSDYRIDIIDTLTFLTKMDFSEFIYCNFSENIESLIKITSSENLNFTSSFTSSTGEAHIKGVKLENISFLSGESLQCHLQYHLPQ